MSFLDRLFQSRASLENPQVSLQDVEAWHELFGAEKSKAGVRLTNKRAIGYPPLYRGITLICNSVAKLELYTYKRTGENGRVRAVEHPAYRLLRLGPNPSMRANLFKKTIQFHATLYGNGYAAIFRDGRGNPVEMLLLSPWETFPFQKDGQLWYRTVIGTEQRKIPARDIYHIRGLSYDGLVGISVIEVMADALGLGIAARDFAARFFSQGANASGILMIPGHLKGDAIKQAMKDFEKIAAGVNNQHKVGLLQDGVKWQPMTINPEQSQMLQTREFEAKEVANILGLPPHKLGDDSRISYNSLEVENQSFLDESLDPWLTEHEGEARHKLLSEEERERDTHYMEFNRGALVRADLNSRYRAYQTGRLGGWLNVNQIRAMENLEAIGPGGDIYLTPANMVPVGSVTGGDNEASVRAAHRETLVELVERLGKVEAEQVRKAAQKDSRFIDSLDRIYDQQREKLLQALTRPLVAWCVSRRREFDESRFAASVDEYLATHKSDVLEAAGRAKDQRALAAEVEAVLGARNAEAVYEFVDQIMGD